ncbi:MAG TPA: fructosamine kinase family protein [Pilimelia sp.]|nr:fructosamine kinase family protein [Pilimelia sp.]
MDDLDLLQARLAAAGLTDVRSVMPVTGGVIAAAGLVVRAGGEEVFAKTLTGDAPMGDLFEVEADGLSALGSVDGVTTPEVLLATRDVLVLNRMWPWPAGTAYWERLGRMLAVLHTTTAADRFGWHRDGWLGRLRQHNGWHTDGHAFFAERRVLRWLPEPLVASEFDADDRRALERLCARLPELVPAAPPVLTHGDLWPGNVLADADGGPALIDPAVSYTWAEVDLSMMWCANRPPESAAFFPAYEEHAGLAPGWRDRMPLLHLRELLSIIAHGDDDWGAATEVRRLIAPFRPRSGT